MSCPRQGVRPLIKSRSFRNGAICAMRPGLGGPSSRISCAGLAPKSAWPRFCHRKSVAFLTRCLIWFRSSGAANRAESAVCIGRRAGRLPRNLPLDSVAQIHGRHLSPPRSRSDIYSQFSLIGMRPRSFLIHGVCDDCQPHPTRVLPSEGTSSGA